MKKGEGEHEGKNEIQNIQEKECGIAVDPAMIPSILWIDVLFPSYIHQLSLFLKYFTGYPYLQHLLAL